MFENIHSFVSRFVNFNNREKKIFENAFSFRQVPANFNLLKEGDVSHEVYFINKGLMRLYYNKEGEYITGYIFRENHFAGCYESFLEQAPGIQYLETLEDCELLTLTHHNMNELYNTLPQMNLLVRKITEERFINAQRVLSSFLLDNPETRYRKFATKNSDLFLRIPHHIIASYLGITPVSLSRIRKRVLLKN